MTAYYNDIDPFSVHILKHLIADGVIAYGHVDDRSIEDVSVDDIKGYAQHHFFAGGGLWSVAARLAGWPDDRPIVTGSCPCQPFSLAGDGKGFADPRHLWPNFHRIIAGLQPHVVFGEQVSGPLGFKWFERVRSDLEPAYFSEAFDIPACAVNAPHIRQRLYWYARLLEDPAVSHGAAEGRHVDDRATAGWLEGSNLDPVSDACSAWDEAEWTLWRDGRSRRDKPGVRLLAYGVPHNMAIKRLTGNAIVPQLAAQLIGAYLDEERGTPLRHERKPRAELKFE